MQQEIWKDIPWFEWIFKCSNKGRIKTVERYATRKNWKYMFVSEKIRRTYNDKNWYERISLRNWIYHKTFWVHQLVMFTFVWKYEWNKNQINHIDYNVKNNNLDNLEFCTPKENNIHKMKREWFSMPKWKEHWWYWKRWKLSKLSKRVWQFKNWILIKEFESLWECARKTWFNISNIWCTIYKKRQNFCHWFDFKYIQ